MPTRPDTGASGASNDAYAREFMSGGTPLVRDRKRMWFHWIFLVLAIVTLGAGGAILAGLDRHASPAFAAIPLAVGAIMSFCWLALTVVRSVVTAQELFIQLGLWGPRIPISAIQSCRVIDYDWTEFGGVGIRRSGDGTWAYTVSGGRVVEATWRDEHGQSKRVVFSAQDPEAVVAAVQRARSAGAGGARIEAAPLGARVDAGEDAGEEAAEEVGEMRRGRRER